MKKNVENVFKNDDKEKRRVNFNIRLAEAINRAEKSRSLKRAI